MLDFPTCLLSSSLPVFVEEDVVNITVMPYSELSGIRVFFSFLSCTKFDPFTSSVPLFMFCVDNFIL